MTTKYESVLSAAERVNLIREHTDIESLVTDTEQATLAKLQPQLDAIGAGGVSGQHVMKQRIPEGYKLVPIVPTMEMVAAGDAKAIKTSWMIGSADVVPAVYHAMLSAAPVPDVNQKLTTESQELRIVFRGEIPNLTFVEVENEDGFSVNVGEWHKRFDGYTELRINTGKE